MCFAKPYQARAELAGGQMRRPFCPGAVGAFKLVELAVGALVGLVVVLTCPQGVRPLNLFLRELCVSLHSVDAATLN